MKLEYNFSNKHLELIKGGDDILNIPFTPISYDPSGIGPTGDYIRMSVFNEDGSFIRSFYSNLSVEDEEIIYALDSTTTPTTPAFVAIANPNGADIGLDSYPISAEEESLDQYCDEVGYTNGYASHTETTADMYYSWWSSTDTITQIQGIDVGGRTDSVLNINMYNASFDGAGPGEVQFDPAAFTFIHPDGTSYEVDQGNGTVSNMEGTFGSGTVTLDSRAAYLVYVGTDQGRFDIPTDAGNQYNKEFVVAYWDETAWTYDNNTGYSSDRTFTPNTQDAIVARLYRNSNQSPGIESADHYYLPIWNLEQGSAQVAASVNCNTSGTDSVPYNADWSTGEYNPQLRIYKDASDNLYVKPNEALEFGDINEGNYQLQFDFLHNPFYVLGAVENANQKYYFYITEVSSTRKEVRLVTRNAADARVPTVDINTGDIVGNWAEQIDGDEENPGVLFNHNFNFVLVISNARNIPITNYKIDKISDPINPSLILKLYSPLPTDVPRLANVTIEREVFTTQIEDIWYKTEAYIDPVDGFGLDYADEFGGFLGIDDV